MIGSRVAGALTLFALLGTSGRAGAGVSIVRVESSHETSGRAGPESAVVAARAALDSTRGASVASLELVWASHPDAGLAVVRFQQTHSGLPVIGKGAAVVLDSDDQPVAVARDVEPNLPADVVPRLTAVDAADIAARFAGVELDGSSARLGLVPSPGGARLVWVVTRFSGVSAPLVLVDANDGTVLLSVDSLHWLDRANAFAGNPVTTPEVSEFVLPLPGGATTLTSASLRALSCVDHHDLRTTPLGTLHVCVAEQRDGADAAGDFLYPTPAPTDPDDPFAEASAFHHASRAIARFVELGVPATAFGQLDVVVNVRWPTGWRTGDTSERKNPDATLDPLPGSFYAASSPVFVAAAGKLGGVWLGQGPVSDYAADGDDIYHEVGHAAVDATVKLVPWLHADAQGLADAPDALNEAMADYFSCALTGDPHVGESVAPNLVAGLAAYRSLDGNARCPADLSGEPHFDSLIVSGALWTVRAGLPATDRGTFDQAVFTALLALPGGDVASEDFAELAVTTVAASTLGQIVADRLQGELTARGVLPHCERVLEFNGTPIDSKDVLRSGSTFLAPGRYDTPWGNLGQPPPLDYTPGIVQVHARVPAGATSLAVSFRVVEMGASPRVLVRWSASPITFPGSAPPDVDAVLDPAMPSPVSASLAVPAGATDVNVMIANAGDKAYHYRAVRLDFTVDSASTPPIATGNLEATGGCTCSAMPSAAPEVYASMWLAAIAAAARRVRFRRGKRRQ